MPTYVTLFNYTQEGIETIDEGPERLDNAKEFIDSLGGEIKAFYLTMGQYDAVAITEFPDDDSAAKAALRSGQTGAVRTETLKAWPEADFRDLVTDLP